MKKHIANVITSSRIVLSLPLLLIPLTSAWFCALYLLCGLSDMIDGTVARRTNSASEFGVRLDTASDFVFMTVALIKFLPHLPIPAWLWIWIGMIAMIKIGNAAWGFVRTKELISPHTLLNKITGLLLFFLPTTLGFVDLTYTLPIVCTVATVAAIHEVYLHIRRKNMILETERLILRPWCEDDAEDLYMYASDPEVGPPAGWLPHTSVENSLEIIRTVLSKPEVYAVCLKENGKPIGNIHLNFKTDMTDREDECELGYWLGKPFWGQGLIPEAARTLLRRAFEDLCVNAVWCGRYDHNEKSRRVQEKLGFVYHHTTEGLLVPQVNEIRTGYVMLMTKERFQKVELFRQQRKTLDTFLQNGAISQSQYDKSFGELRELMEMQGVE